MVCEMSLYQKFYLACKLGYSDKAMQYFLEAVANEEENIVDYFILLWRRYE